jgi:iron(III) transport system substrate-binding protein
VPAGYPADYAQVIETARREGRLLVYSTVSVTNWRPFPELWAQRYPGIAVETTDTNDHWEKYHAEAATRTRTADLIVAAAPDRWADFVARGQAVDYVSPETPALPRWSLPAPGVYTASADPVIIAYNRRALQGLPAPRSLQDVALLLREHPDLRGRITVFDPEGNGMGRAIWMAWTQMRPDGWSMLDAMGPALRPERSAGPMREKVVSGEYAVAIFSSGAGIPMYMASAASRLAAWGFPTDGTPVVARNVAITRSAGSPNAARLFLDLLLSRDGQIAFARTGQTPYRSDIAKSDVPYETFGTLIEAIGERNVILIAPGTVPASGEEAFLARWRQALRR